MAFDKAMLYWTAGFLEGEGSFFHSLRVGVKKYSGTLTITAPQVQREPLERLTRFFGGRLTLRTRSNVPNASPCFVWVLYGGQAAGLMMTLYPLMSPKRQGQIRTALKKWRSRGASFGSQHINSSVSDDSMCEAVQRYQAGESIASIARAKGVSAAAVYHWLNGDTRRDVNHISVIRPPRITSETAHKARAMYLEGIGQQEIARQLGVIPNTVSNWIRGGNNRLEPLGPSLIKRKPPTRNIPDEVVITTILRYWRGASARRLAAELDIDEFGIYHWANGSHRPRCREQALQMQSAIIDTPAQP